ncbi:hypothetical protein L6452_00873 [Arctium lappa]|uniref:Uncharacterized protein n=1 Tax=Arctium lappa TaxID=4217 RepID=A0ACB9FFY4_ARCLA|nr:hypothetical protein L6452_00873 [Arctium lappa]
MFDDPTSDVIFFYSLNEKERKTSSKLVSQDNSWSVVFFSTKMTTEKIQAPSAPAPAPAMDSCRKKKSDDATFLQDVKDHIDEFIHASMDEHKTCFKKSISKMFGMSKIVAERNAAENKGIESSLPLRTVVSD